MKKQDIKNMRANETLPPGWQWVEDYDGSMAATRFESRMDNEPTFMPGLERNHIAMRMNDAVEREEPEVFVDPYWARDYITLEEKELVQKAVILRNKEWWANLLEDYASED